MDLLVPIVLIILLVVVAAALVLTIRTLKRLADCIEGLLGRTQEEITTTLRKVQATLDRVENLAQSSDQLLREDVTSTLDVARSTLTEVKMATRGVSDTVGGVQRVVKGLVAMSGPGALAVVTQRLIRKGNKLGLLAFGVGTGLRVLFNGSRRNRP